MKRNRRHCVRTGRIGHVSAIISILVVSASAAAQDFITESFTVDVTTDIQYGTGATLPSGTFDLFLDLYEPSGAGVPAMKPGFVLVHGGAWYIGDKDVGDFNFGPGLDGQDVAILANELASRGYVCVSINYRMYGDNPAGTGFLSGSGQTQIIDVVQALFPSLTDTARIVRSVEAGVADTVTAIQWLISQSGALGVDPTRIAVGGYSAGAFNSLFAGHGAGAPVRAVWMNSGGFGDNTDFAMPGGPPVISFHGDLDTVLPVSFGQTADAALDSAGVVSDYFEMPGEDHFYFFNQTVGIPAKAGGTIEEEIVDFMYTHLELATIGSGPLLPAASPAALLLLALALVLAGFLTYRASKRVVQ